MAKRIGMGNPLSDPKWEREFAARRGQSEFTEKANSNFEKSDTILRPRQTNAGERLPPIGCARTLRVGCFEHPKKD